MDLRYVYEDVRRFKSHTLTKFWINFVLFKLPYSVCIFRCHLTALCQRLHTSVLRNSNSSMPLTLWIYSIIFLSSSLSIFLKGS
jgi:hypothetical protein